MRDDEPQVIAFQHLSGTSRTISVAHSMKSETAQTPFARPCARDRVDSRRVGDGRAKRRVKRRDLRHARQQLLYRVDHIEAHRVVQGGQFRHFIDGALDDRSDQNCG